MGWPEKSVSASKPGGRPPDRPRRRRWPNWPAGCGRRPSPPIAPKAPWSLEPAKGCDDQATEKCPQTVETTQLRACLRVWSAGWQSRPGRLLSLPHPLVRAPAPFGRLLVGRADRRTRCRETMCDAELRETTVQRQAAACWRALGRAGAASTTCRTPVRASEENMAASTEWPSAPLRQRAATLLFVKSFQMGCSRGGHETMQLTVCQGARHGAAAPSRGTCAECSATRCGPARRRTGGGNIAREVPRSERRRTCRCLQSRRGGSLRPQPAPLSQFAPVVLTGRSASAGRSSVRREGQAQSPR